MQVPYGYCECGCGQRTNIPHKTNKRLNQIKGRPVRFISGHNSHTGTPEERYWPKVIKGASPDTCWQWRGGTTPFGYGVLFLTKHPKRTFILAHRFSYQLHNGPISDDVKILHTCDNPPCSNPRHLIMGTQATNLADMWYKGRAIAPPLLRGAIHPRTALTENIVTELRQGYPFRDCSRAAFAARYTISETALKAILARRSWKHVP